MRTRLGGVNTADSATLRAAFATSEPVGPAAGDCSEMGRTLSAKHCMHVRLRMDPKGSGRSFCGASGIADQGGFTPFGRERGERFNPCKRSQLKRVDPSAVCASPTPLGANRDLSPVSRHRTVPMEPPTSNALRLDNVRGATPVAARRLVRAARQECSPAMGGPDMGLSGNYIAVSSLAESGRLLVSNVIGNRTKQGCCRHGRPD